MITLNDNELITCYIIDRELIIVQMYATLVIITAIVTNLNLDFDKIITLPS